MLIKYENRFSDLLVFNSIHQFLSPAMQGLWIVLCVFIFQTELSNGTVTLAFITTFVWYVGLWIFQFLFNAIWLFSRKNGAVLTTHTLEIQPEALFEETKFNRFFFYWPGVVKAVSRPGFVGIYVSPHLAHVIPNRAFHDKIERASFLALVKEKMRAATAQV